MRYDYRMMDRYPYDDREMGDFAYDGRRRSSRTGRYMRDSYPFEMRGRVGDFSYDGHGKVAILEEEILSRWAKNLSEEIEEKDKQYYKMENIIRIAEDMGIRFDKFTPEEFYVTTLMVYTDYKDALGMTNPETYAKLAKYWLCDKDAELRYGEKLAAYYYSVVKGEL